MFYIFSDHNKILYVYNLFIDRVIPIPPPLPRKKSFVETFFFLLIVYQLEINSRIKRFTNTWFYYNIVITQLLLFLYALYYININLYTNF